jgi:hypothetical protein
MIRRASILFLLLAASAAAYEPPPPGANFYRYLVSSAGYSDAITAHPLTRHYWTVLDTASIALDGTNVASWTATVGGNVAAPTNAVQRPWWDAADYGNHGGLGFGGGQAMNLSVPIPSTNALIVVVGFRATQSTMFGAIARHDSTGGPYLGLWNNTTAYFNPDANDTGIQASAAAMSNRFVFSAAHFGGNVTTNNTAMWFNSVRISGVSTFSQAGPGPSFTRIGARQADGWAIGRINAVMAFYPVNDTNEAQSIIATVQGVYPL